MKRESKTQYALLGILSQCEMSGYEIKKFVETSLGFFWNESFGQIYPTLKNMEEMGWVTSSEAVAEDSNKTKIVYKISKLGLKELKHWLENSTTNIMIRNELLLKVFFGRNMEKTKFLSMLTGIKEKLQEELNLYMGIKKSIKGNTEPHPDTKYWLYTLDYGIESTKTGISWIQNVIKDQVEESSGK
ncbi:MAG: PadR family transcriptional regulator [Leptospira sp.]|nr:PadR family transcriptional regulator [Leptospira sp.]